MTTGTAPSQTVSQMQGSFGSWDSTNGNQALGVFGSTRGILLLGSNYTAGLTDIAPIKFIYGPLSTTDENAATIASISAYNTTTSSTSGGVLRISTRTPSSTLTERMRIDSSGNVGIWTTFHQECRTLIRNLTLLEVSIDQVRFGTHSSTTLKLYINFHFWFCFFSFRFFDISIRPKSWTAPSR